MTFNVMTDPWITARCLNDKYEQHGIYGILANAHLMSCIEDSRSYFEFAEYRLLTVLLMDAYRPKTKEDIRKLLDTGHFDMSVIDRYVDECHREGVTFDLFDPDRPFMQCARSEWPEELCDRPQKSIAELDCMVASGNNHIHFENGTSEHFYMPVEDIPAGLAATCLFCTPGKKGPSSPNSIPPTYVMVVGRNLFETLVYGMVPSENFEHYGDTAPLWRRIDPVVRSLKVQHTSLLRGMLYPSRRVLVLTRNMKNGMLHDVLFEEGQDYVGYDEWTDPHVPYFVSPKGIRCTVRPSVDRQGWRDLPAMLDYAENAPMTVTQYLELNSTDTLRLVTYGASSNQSKYLGMHRAEYTIPKEVALNEARHRTFNDIMHEVEATGIHLVQACKAVAENGGLRPATGRAAKETNDAATRYFYSCYKIVLNDAIFRLADIPDDAEKLQCFFDEIKARLVKAALNEYDMWINRCGAPARILLMSQKFAIKITGRPTKDKSDCKKTKANVVEKGGTENDQAD